MPAYQYVYVMKGLSRTYPGGREVLKGITLSFFPGAKIGVIGVNGSGKSTLLRIMAGLDHDFSGEAWAADGAKVGYLPQEPQLDPDKTVLENVMLGLAPTQALLDRFNEISARFAEPLDDDEMATLLEEQGELQEQIDAANGWELERTVEIAMDALRCPPGDADPATLSGGERRRVALCRLLLEKPDLLLLDEPTNHLDAGIGRLAGALPQGLLRHGDGRHPRPLLPRQRHRLDPGARSRARHPLRGQLLVVARAEAEAARHRGEAGDGAAADAGARARLDPRQPARPAGEVEGAHPGVRDPLAESMERAPGTAQIAIPPGPRLGSLVIEAEHLRKGYGDRLLIENLSFRLPPGGIVGVIGPNGAGKTTLFRMIVGQEKPDAGTIRLGETVKLGYVDQSRDALDAKKTVWEEISGGLDELELGKRKMSSRAYVGQFNFHGPDQQKKVGDLSGGERNRVHLAKMLKSGANVLLLDEPTNDLDVDTLRALEEALIDFAGCAVIISHDRWFLDRIATHILAFEGDSQVVWFEGNFQDYEADKKRRLGADADQPHRIKYKPLFRG